jgi:hypothetical protein
MAPALAGGALRYLNAILWALVKTDGRVKVELDYRLLTTKDCRLLLLNSRGDRQSIGLQKPMLGREWRMEPQEHNSLMEAALCCLAETSEAEGAAERLLPRVGESLLEASVRLWTDLFAKHGLEVTVAESAGATEELGQFPETTWLGPRQAQSLRALRISPEDALAGEAELRKMVQPSVGQETLDRINLTAGKLGALSKELGAELQREEPKLYASWNRFNRDLNKSSSLMRRRARHYLNNRSGISGARLHLLAQSLRPLDLPQQEELSLLVPVASFRLGLDRLEKYISYMKSIVLQVSVLVPTP